MSRWDRLSIGDRAALVSLFVNNGVVDPKEMRRIYDNGGDTADIKPAVIEASYPREREVLDLVNKSGADFVSRLNDENRVTIPDWKNNGGVATHKLGYAEVDGKYVVYPLVQNIDGKLYDFSDPQYGMDKGWQALDSALYAGDYVELPSKADARWFAESYKNHYPGFNKYKDGGDKNNGVDAISGADTNPVDTDPQKSKTAWFDWWYKFRGKQIDDERKASAKYLTSKNKYNTDFLNYVNSRINSVGESYNDINGEIDSPEFITAASKDSVARKQILDYGHDYNSDDYDESANIVDWTTRGFYTPSLNHIIYNPKNGRLRDDTIIHERTHTLRDNPFYYNYTSTAKKFVKDGNHILMDDNDFDDYLDSRKEVYARLNAFRYTNNLNPSHNITKDEINAFRKNGLLKKYDLDRYTDDWLYFLFNGLADSGESIRDEYGVNSAALGGLFNKYDGKTERSQQMVKLGEDDYFVPEELEAAAVIADSKEKPKIEIPIEYLFPERNDVDNKIDTLRDVMQSLVDREKKKKTTSVDILKSYRGAYNNPFLANPFYMRYAGINRFDEGSDDSTKVFDTGTISQGKKFNAFDRWASDHPQAMMRLRKAKTLVGDALALHPVLGIYDDISDIVKGMSNKNSSFADEFSNATTGVGLLGKTLYTLWMDDFNNVFGNDIETRAYRKKIFNSMNLPDKINDSVKFIKDFSTPVEEFANGGETDGLHDVLEPSFISAEKKPMSKRQIRKNSRIARNVLDNLTDGNSYTPLQKKRMVEYIIRAQGGFPNPSIPRVVEMRKGLKYKNKDGISGLERVLYGNEKIKDIIDSINADHISYDDDGSKIVRGFSMFNYNGNRSDIWNKYDNDIVDAYINGVAPYGGIEYTGEYNFGPYKNYLSKYYSNKNIKSYMFGRSELPQDVVDRLDRYSYERGDNSYVVGANTDKGVGFKLPYGDDTIDFDAAGHIWQFIKDDDGRFYVRQSDSYDFEPNQYRESYGDLPYVTQALSAFESAGNPVLVFTPWREADPSDLSKLTKGNVSVNNIDDESIKKTIEYNKQIKNGKFLNAIDNGLTLIYSATR